MHSLQAFMLNTDSKEVSKLYLERRYIEFQIKKKNLFKISPAAAVIG